jgi:archaellum component FlaC
LPLLFSVFRSDVQTSKAASSARFNQKTIKYLKAIFAEVATDVNPLRDWTAEDNRYFFHF